MKARIVWQHKESGVTGGGQAIAHSAAVAWVKKLNTEYPFLRHWVELVV